MTVTLNFPPSISSIAPSILCLIKKKKKGKKFVELMESTLSITQL